MAASGIRLAIAIMVLGLVGLIMGIVLLVMAGMIGLMPAIGLIVVGAGVALVGFFIRGMMKAMGGGQ
jgi:hypothetical protein